jgi:prolyl oligopeptidase
VYSSLVTPPTVLVGRLRAALPTAPVALTPVDTARTDAPLDQLVLSRASVPSADGTAINVFYVHRRGIAMDGTNPVLLYGYGGFNVSLTPSFRRDPLYWVERGGVYAIANLRGGAEFGEAWHRAGHRENKHHVFEGHGGRHALALHERPVAPRPHRAAGRQQRGGLLMGAMLTRAPDTFRAAVSSVGLYDMVRFHRFPPAEIWTSELGDPEQADAFRWLYAYSPYHRVRDGVAYPAVWIETADHDTRVHWAHSTKFAARLQDATSSDRPVFFHMQRGMGHGSATLRSEQLRTLVRVYTFLEDQLGMTSPPAATPATAPSAATPAP